MTYSKEPNRINSLTADAPIFIADGAGATMILALVDIPTAGAN